MPKWKKKGLVYFFPEIMKDILIVFVAVFFLLVQNADILDIAQF